MKHGPEWCFVIERMIEGGAWIPWQTRFSMSIFLILNELANTYPPEALESVRVRKPCQTG